MVSLPATNVAVHLQAKFVIDKVCGIAKDKSQVPVFFDSFI